MVFGIPGSSWGSWRVSLRWSLTLWLSTPRKDSNVPKTEPQVLLRSPEVHLEDIKEVWQEKCCWKAMEIANVITNLPIFNGLWEVFWWWLWSHRMTTVNGWSYRNTIQSKHIPKTDSNLHKFLSWFILIHCGSCGRREQNARNIYL